MSITAAPTLTTPRLTLRPHRADDLAACMELWQDPVITRHTTGRPLPRQDVWTRLLRHPGHWALLGFGYWALEERQSGRFVGEVGLGRFKRDMFADHPELNAIPEAGWVLLPWAHGKGYAAEAMAAVLEWRDAHLPDREIFCIITPDNAPSLRLAGRLGFTVTGEASTPEDRVLVLTRQS